MALFHSLRSRLLLLLLSAVFVVTLIITWISVKQGQTMIEANRAELLHQLASGMAFQLNKDMQSRGNEIQMLTALSDIQNPQVSMTQKRAIFEKMRKAYPYYAWIGMTDDQGNILAGTDNLLVGKSVAKRSWFLEGSKGLHLGSVHDAFLLAKIMPKPKWDDLPLRLVDVSAPIKDENGKLLGVICGHLGWDWAFEMRHKLLSSSNLQHVNLMVAKADGSLLMGTEKLPSGAFNLSGLAAFDQALLSEHQGFAIENWPDNHTYMTSVVYEQSPENAMLQWVVVAQEKMQDVTAVVNDLKVKIILLLLVMMLVLWAVVWRVVSGSTRHLEKLTAAADGIQKGDMDIRIPTVKQQDEVGILANSLSTLVHTLQDEIREKTQVAQALQLMARVHDDSPQGIMITDANQHILSINQAFIDVTGYTEADVLGKTPIILRSGRQDKVFYEKLWHTLNREGRWQGEIWNRSKSGEVFPEWLLISTLKNEQNEVTHYIAIFSDITDKKQAEQQLVFLANHDVLTQLPNRRLLQDTINRFIQFHPKDEVSQITPQVGVIFLDLDFFKSINDSLGHLVGDQLLKVIADTLNAQFKSPNLVARFGGDEFVIFMAGILDDQQLIYAAESVVSCFEKPFKVGDYSLQIGLTMGMSVYPRDGSTAESLISAADTAMYDIKRNHRRSYQFYSLMMREAAYEKLSMENDLKLALANHEFYLVYQPQVSMQGYQLSGLEALIRWQHPSRGLVSPKHFIPVLEEMGLIEEVGLWVVREALKQYQIWLAAYPIQHVSISINLSAVQLRNPKLTDMLQKEVKASNVLCKQVIFEVTESVMVDEDVRIRKELNTLQENGCHFALDDYGTGYSNLAYIDQFNLSELKIDQAFIQKMQNHATDRLIIHHTIEMAKALGMKVVAEGVEMASQMALLSAYPEIFIQGYYFDRPLSAEQMTQRLETRADLVWEPALKTLN
ncbi:bifunctional diguanylate cyclase/phosphodiesterase [Thiosulfativibrio zosterae]|uniref:GGDEF domain-containing protein n=1 Tax=Thiosulfativibrio zosterae TaxID=2675053 RepID=A0A6F8PJQ5_9GAMM|nr:EAL domain-containing protein [Thiosulfativibrio zosterae]BBP42329.1 hypothetical protein THMIRHAT_00750 [Thiosulfativibrio zosterae]